MKVWIIWNEKETNNKSIDKIFSTEEKRKEQSSEVFREAPNLTLDRGK